MMKDMGYFGDFDFKFDDRQLKALISSQSDEDKKLFNMDLSNIEWDKYFFKVILGIKKYILKESEDPTLGLKRYQTIMLVYYSLWIIIYGCLLYLSYVLLKMIFLIN